MYKSLDMIYVNIALEDLSWTCELLLHAGFLQETQRKVAIGLLAHLEALLLYLLSLLLCNNTTDATKSLVVSWGLTRVICLCHPLQLMILKDDLSSCLLINDQLDGQYIFSFGLNLAMSLHYIWSYTSQEAHNNGKFQLYLELYNQSQSKLVTFESSVIGLILERKATYK